MKHTILNGDCQDVLKTLDANSIDAILTDPPYGLNMAGWDHSIPPQRDMGRGITSAEARRVYARLRRHTHIPQADLCY